MVKRGLLLVVVVFAVVIAGVLMNGCDSGAPAEWGPIDGEKAMEHVKVMVALGPRPSGSAALLKNRDYLRDYCQKTLGLKTFEQNWTDPKSKLRMHNLWTEIPGTDPDGRLLIFAAHYDTKLCEGHDEKEHNFPFKGAIDGAGGSAVLLELARVLKDRKNVPTVWILWLDGEESIPWDWDDSQALHGSRYFVEKMKADKKLFPKGLAARLRAFVLIDLVGSKHQKIDRDLNSHPLLNQLFEDAGKKMGEEARMFATKSEMIDDHIPFKNAGVRVIDLIDFHFRTPKGEKKEPYEQWWHTDKDDIDAMDPVSLSFVGNLLWTAMPLLEERCYPSSKKAK